MAERSPSAEIWVGRGAYLGIVLVLTFVALLPLETLPPRWPPPDLVLAVTLAWVARRPDFVPVLSVAGVFFLLDLLTGRPPGLWTALVIVATEILRRQSGDLRAVRYPLEWATVAVTVVTLTVAYRMILFLTVSPLPPLEPAMIRMVLTVLAYPLVTVVSFAAFGVRRPAPGEVDALGHRL